LILIKYKLSTTILSMAHERIRFIEDSLTKDLKWSPVVAIYGLRQVGKTTLAHRLAKNFKGVYESLDSKTALEATQAAPREFLMRTGLLAIDEAQKAPWLFSVIKMIVGIKRKPSQFLLTGSYRLTLKRDIREALTGRVLLHELLPFSIAEAHATHASNFLKMALIAADKRQSLKRKARSTVWVKKDFEHYAIAGGLPIPCFTRDFDRRATWFSSYFETLITRDLPLIDEKLSTLTIRQGLSLLRALSLFQGQEFTVSELSHQTSISSSLLRRAIHALESLFIIDLIPAFIGHKKAIRKPRLEWKDIGLWTNTIGMQTQILNSEIALKLLISQELRGQLSLLRPRVEWLFLKTRDMAEIPWIFKRGTACVAAIFVASETPHPYQYRSLKKFIEKNNSTIGIVFGLQYSEFRLIAPQIWLVPYTDIF